MKRKMSSWCSLLLFSSHAVFVGAKHAMKKKHHRTLPNVFLMSFGEDGIRVCNYMVSAFTHILHVCGILTRHSWGYTTPWRFLRSNSPNFFVFENTFSIKMSFRNT